MKKLSLVLILLLAVGCSPKKKGQQITSRKSAVEKQQKAGKPADKDQKPAAGTGDQPEIPQAGGDKPKIQQTGGEAPSGQPASPEATGSTPQLQPQPRPATATTQNTPGSAEVSGSAQFSLIELNFDETYNTLSLLNRYFGKNSEGMMTPVIPLASRIEEYSYDLVGGFEQATLTLKKKNQQIVQFVNAKLNLKEPIRAQSGAYTLVATCVGAECEIVAASIYQKTGDKISENIPVVFKKVDTSYKPAKFMEMKAFAEEFEGKQNEAQDPDKAPPQMKVAYLLATNTNKHQVNLLAVIRKQMKDANHIYSARLFPNLESGSCSPDLKFENSQIRFLDKCEFVESEKRKTIIFNGPLQPDLTNFLSTAGMKLSVHTIKEETDLVKGVGFYLLTYLTENFKSPIDQVKSAVQSRLCQLLVEKAVSYTECEFVPSTVVLEGMVLEGYYDGPFYSGDKSSLVDGKTISTPVILKDRSALPKKEESVVTGGH